MVREHQEVSLLAQEMERGYRAPCTALIAPSATEWLQLPRWICADKKGALGRAGIQLADGCRSLACCYSAPPEPDLIWMQPPSQPTPAASSSGHQVHPDAAPCPSSCSEGAQEQHVRRSTHHPAPAAPAACCSMAVLQHCLREPAPIVPVEEAASSPTLPEPDLFIITSCVP